MVDHKSFPGSLEEALACAAGRAGQVRAYAEAVAAALMAKTVGTFLYLPVAGRVRALS